MLWISILGRLPLLRPALLPARATTRVREPVNPVPAGPTLDGVLGGVYPPARAAAGHGGGALVLEPRRPPVPVCVPYYAKALYPVEKKKGGSLYVCI